MAGIKQIRFCGFGGQGIILAGTTLGHAAVRDGRWVAGSNYYGAAARGGICRAEVVISEQRIVYPLVINADILVAMSQSAYDLYIGDVTEAGGVVLYDAQMVYPRQVEGLRQIGVPATREAIERLGNKQVANMIILGATVGQTGVVTSAALMAAIEGTVEERLKELNLKAADVGLRLGKTPR